MWFISDQNKQQNEIVTQQHSTIGWVVYYKSESHEFEKNYVSWASGPSDDWNNFTVQLNDPNYNSDNINSLIIYNTE